jgi:hypothetical protein
VVFVAPVVSGAGPRFVGELGEPVRLHGFDARTAGDDVVLSAYVHAP